MPRPHSFVCPSKNARLSRGITAAFFFAGTLLAASAAIAIITGLLGSCAVSKAAVPETARGARLVLTAGDEQLGEHPVLYAVGSAPDFFSVQGGGSGQEIEGWGGAFNEKGWDALLALDPDDREYVLRELFDPETGLRFNICRVPIGASDYAMDRYTLDESPGDYDMAAFGVERDEKMLIPYIKAAMAFRPDLKLWGSAWSPPTWMKTNRDYEGGAFRDEDAVYRAYALYLLRFVEAYRARGMDVAMVVPQNEPGQLTGYPSCDWTGEQLARFIRDYAGPLFREEGGGAEVWLGTINQGDWDRFVKPTLSDPGARSFTGGACVQWGGVELLPRFAREAPGLRLMQSETECGNCPWLPGYDPDRPQNDLAYAAYTWRKIRDYIAGGCASYMLWNMVLDAEGKNIDRGAPWPQNAAVVVDRTTRTATFTPMFWATKHFSSLVPPGSRYAPGAGSYADAVAFVDPEGRTIVELLNDGPAERRVAVSVGARNYACVLPAGSFATLIVEP